MATTHIETLESVLDKTTDLIAGMRPDQRDAPSPCSGMNAAELVDHIIGWLRLFGARASETAYDGDPRTYRAGDDPTAEVEAAVKQTVGGFRARTDDSTMTFGPEMGGAGVPAAMALGLMVGEYLGHGWDLAKATGQPVPFTEAEAAVGLEALHQQLSPDFRGPGKNFGYEVEVPATASAMDRLVGFIGREPAWGA